VWSSSFRNAGPPFAPFGGITRIRFKGFHGKPANLSQRLPCKQGS
jgi:hypothetical protein